MTRFSIVFMAIILGIIAYSCGEKKAPIKGSKFDRIRGDSDAPKEDEANFEEYLESEDFGEIEDYVIEEDYYESGISASSTMAPFGNISYVPYNVQDNDLYTWWSPNSKKLNNCWILLSFDTSLMISGISIHNGSHYPNFVDSNGNNYGNLFKKNLRVKEARIEFSDGSVEYIKLDDIDAIQEVYFSGRNSEYLKFYPLSYYPSTKWQDVCISHLEVL